MSQRKYSKRANCKERPRRDMPHILASRRCETFENLLHTSIDIAPVFLGCQRLLISGFG